MGDESHEIPRHTPKGERTRARIIRAAAALIHARGMERTTMDELKAAAGVSSSQLYHYFANKDQLVQAVVSHQADVIVTNQKQADMGNVDGLRAWRDTVIAEAQRGDAAGGCHLGSLGSQLAESDPRARALVAEGFERWSAALGDGLRSLQAAGGMATDIPPGDVAVILLAVLQGGLLLAQVQRSTRPLETALDGVLALVTNHEQRGL